MREYRKRGESVIPKLAWYAGASDHFGEIRNRRYAKDFFTTLLGTR